LLAVIPTGTHSVNGSANQPSPRASPAGRPTNAAPPTSTARDRQPGGQPCAR